MRNIARWAFLASLLCLTAQAAGQEGAGKRGEEAAPTEQKGPRLLREEEQPKREMTAEEKARLEELLKKIAARTAGAKGIAAKITHLSYEQFGEGEIYLAGEATVALQGTTVRKAIYRFGKEKVVLYDKPQLTVARPAEKSAEKYADAASCREILWSLGIPYFAKETIEQDFEIVLPDDRLEENETPANNKSVPRGTELRATKTVRDIPSSDRIAPPMRREEQPHPPTLPLINISLIPKSERGKKFCTSIAIVLDKETGLICTMTIQDKRNQFQTIGFSDYKKLESLTDADFALDLIGYTVTSK